MTESKEILDPIEFNKLDINQIEAELCKRSFYYFVQSFWDTFDPAKPYWNWHIEYICNELQEAGLRLARGEKKTEDIIINVSPGQSKSNVISMAFPCWLWAINPTLKIICASYAQAISLDLSTKSRNVITSDRYKIYFPYVELKADQQGKSDFYTTKGGMRFSTSVGSAVTGKHYDLAIMDDTLNIGDYGQSLPVFQRKVYHA